MMELSNGMIRDQIQADDRTKAQELSAKGLPEASEQAFVLMSSRRHKKGRGVGCGTRTELVAPNLGSRSVVIAPVNHGIAHFVLNLPRHARHDPPATSLHHQPMYVSDGN